MTVPTSITMKQKLENQVCLQTRAHRRILEKESRVVNTSNSNWVSWCSCGAFREERNNLDLGGTETGSGQLEFLRISAEMSDGLAGLCGVFTTRVCTAQLLSTFDLGQNGKRFFTRSALQICCQVRSNKCCEMSRVTEALILSTPCIPLASLYIQ